MFSYSDVEAVFRPDGSTKWARPLFMTSVSAGFPSPVGMTAVPVVLERTGFPGGEVTVTSVPDLSFHMSDGAKTWVVTYNSQTGSVNGKPADDPEPVR